MPNGWARPPLAGHRLRGEEPQFSCLWGPTSGCRTESQAGLLAIAFVSPLAPLLAAASWVWRRSCNFAYMCCHYFIFRWHFSFTVFSIHNKLSGQPCVLQSRVRICSPLSLRLSFHCSPVPPQYQGKRSAANCSRDLSFVLFLAKPYVKCQYTSMALYK